MKKDMFYPTTEHEGPESRGIFYNRPKSQVGNTNSTQGILRVVVTGNIECLPTG